MSAILQDISEKLQKGKMKEVAELVKQAVADGIQPLTILNEGLMPGMDIIGERFKKNDIFIPEVLIAARAMAAGTDVLRPLLVGDQMEEKGTVVIGTIKDDLHDIGKNLVRMMMNPRASTSSTSATACPRPNTLKPPPSTTPTSSPVPPCSPPRWSTSRMS